jgi:hypothetical protein
MSDVALPGQRVTKIEAAQRQLRTAIALFFQDGDDICVHTLVAAARQILMDLLHREGKESLIAESRELLIEEEGQKQFRIAIAAAENFFKHANRDPDASLEFKAEQTHFLLVECADAYRTLTGRYLRELVAFLAWFMLEYPHLLHPGPQKDAARAAVGEGSPPHHDRPAFFVLFSQQPLRDVD